MTEMHVVPGDLHRAAASVRSAADEVDASDVADHLTGAAAAVPGSTAADLLTGMGPTWEDDLDRWVDAADGFADGVAAHADTMATTDDGVGGRMSGLDWVLGGLFGGGR
jgi:hypothetical protein